MATSIDLPCPKCEKILKVPESAFGKKLKCKYCGEKFEVERVDLDDLEDDDEEDSPKPKKPAGKVAKPSSVGTSKPGGTVKSKKENEGARPQAKPLIFRRTGCKRPAIFSQVPGRKPAFP